MFWTYILCSEVFDKYYIGFTSDLDNRVIAHNHPKNRGYTRKFIPWKLVYFKKFDTKKEFMEYEVYFKSLKSKVAILNIINMNKK